ncbi:MAG: polysaccharide deacetylase family protein [Thermoleophilia bacterium]
MRRIILISVTGLLLVSMLAISLACSLNGQDGDEAVSETSGSAQDDEGRYMPQSGADDSVTKTATTGSEVETTPGVLLFGIGMHIEPRGASPSSVVGGNAAGPTWTNKGDYNDPAFFQRHVEDIQSVAAIVEKHTGSMTVQAQTPFTTVAASSGNPVLSELAASGHEIALHFHEESHLGKNANELPADTWCAVMKEEIGYIRQAAGSEVDIRYWSGGNLYPGLIDAASCAGLDVNSDWKNPNEQTTVSDLIGINPWRPAGGSSGNDVSQFAAHDPDGPVVYLPDGSYDRNDYGGARRGISGDQAYFDFLKDSLMKSLAEAEADPSHVSVFHFTVHPGEFRGEPEHPFEVIDRFLTEVVDPLVASGRVQWATFSEMADSYEAWEQANPGVSPKA